MSSHFRGMGQVLSQHAGFHHVTLRALFVALALVCILVDRTLAQAAVNPRDFGAQGDGVTNDTAAFDAAAQFIANAGGGTMTIPPGVYIVGRQTHIADGEPNPTGGNPWYVPAPIIKIANCTGPVIIQGDPAALPQRPILRTADGLKFGSFDPDTGQRFDPEPSDLDDGGAACSNPASRSGFFASGRQAYRTNVNELGVIFLEGNSDVTIQNLELDGNLGHLSLGGYFGEVSCDGNGLIVGGSRQGQAAGIFLLSNEMARVENVYTHHHAADGLFIEYDGLKTILIGDPGHRTPHAVTDVVSEWNGRAAIVWEGGIGLTVLDSKFNHSGKALNIGDNVILSSKPACGLDIEIEDPLQDTLCRDGLFENCEFVNNASTGMLSDGTNGLDSGYAQFRNCLFWGTAPSGIAIFPRNRALVFENCQIYGYCLGAWGDPDPMLANKFINCDFEDKEHPQYGVSTGDHLIDMWGDNVLFDQCRVIANHRRAFFVYGRSATGYDVRTMIRNTVITHKWEADPGEYQSLFWGSTRLENVTFLESFSMPYPERHWYINDGHCGPDHHVRLTNVHVTGPSVGWGDGRYFDPVNPILPPCVNTDANPDDTWTAIPARFELGQSRPNPFSSRTAMRVGLPKGWSAEAVLEIYNCQGKVVRSYNLSNMKPGYHVVVWDGLDWHHHRVSSGVYFYAIRSGTSTTERKKTIVAR